jgi:hypothetical protein
MDSSDSVCRILASRDAREDAFCPSRSFQSQLWHFEALSQRLHIGANDITNPTYFGVTVDFVDASPFLANTIL